jgi:pimeloyl-ACP methyl ester carboxylesterase
MANFRRTSASEVTIPFPGFQLAGELEISPGAPGVVVFAHGSGSSRHSPRNQYVARILREHSLGTLLFDLLTEAEEREDAYTGHLRFDIGLLAERLARASDWLHQKASHRQLGYFGSSTGGGAALVAAADSDVPVSAIVSRGGRPDLAGAALAEVKAPTLLIVGGDDTTVIELNREALARMRCLKQLHIIPHASHLFEEPGALEKVAALAAGWFARYFSPTGK